MPNGWTLGVISDLADTVMGYAFKSADFTKTGIPLLRMGNLYQNALSFDRNPIYLPESFKNEYERFLVKPNDLVMSMTGTMGKRDYGFTVKIPTDAPYSLLNQRVIKFVPKHQSSSGFILNLLRSEIILSRLYAIPGGTKQANLSAKQIQELPAPIPPLSEQCKIAKILSTWDKAISNTERLIDNSKQQKKALMQQLLTGKKRLLDDSGKPFEGEWEESSIDSCFKLITDYVASGSFASLKENVSVSDYENFAHYVRQTDLAAKFTNKNLKWVDERSYNFLVKSNLHEGDILFTNIGDLGKVFYMPRLKKPATVAPNLVVLRVNESNDSKFIYYLLASDVGQREIHKIKSGTGLPKINKTEFKTMKFQIPALNEQQKIASVLSTADNEIELLEQQLADLKQEKKALMQQLLTGKRRVAV